MNSGRKRDAEWPLSPAPPFVGTALLLLWGCCACRGCHGDGVTLTRTVSSCDSAGDKRDDGERSPRLPQQQ